MSERQDVLREASGIAFDMAKMYRNGDYGDDCTSREVRDAIEHVGSVLLALANNPLLSVKDVL